MEMARQMAYARKIILIKRARPVKQEDDPLVGYRARMEYERRLMAQLATYFRRRWRAYRNNPWKGQNEA